MTLSPDDAISWEGASLSNFRFEPAEDVDSWVTAYREPIPENLVACYRRDAEGERTDEVIYVWPVSLARMWYGGQMGLGCVAGYEDSIQGEHELFGVAFTEREAIVAAEPEFVYVRGKLHVCDGDADLEVGGKPVRELVPA